MLKIHYAIKKHYLPLLCISSPNSGLNNLVTEFLQLNVISRLLDIKNKTGSHFRFLILFNCLCFMVFASKHLLLRMNCYCAF